MRSRGAYLVAACLVAAGGAAAPAQEGQWRAFTDSGWKLGREGDPAAEEHLTRALKHAEEFPANDSRRALTQSYLAYVTAKRGKKDDADRYAKEALAAFDALPADTNDPHAGRGLNALALMYQARKDYTKADRLYQRSIAAEEKARGAESTSVAQLLGNRAGCLEAQGRYEEAEPLRKRQVAILDVPAAKDRVKAAAAAHRELGRLYRKWGRDAQAEPHLVRAVDLYRSPTRRDEPAAAGYLTDLGRLYLDLKKPDKAESPLREALTIREKTAGKELKDQIELSDSMHDLASVYLADGRYTAAEPMFERALAIREKAFPGGDLRVAVTLQGLAATHVGRKRHQQAEGELLRALQIKEKVLGKNHLGVAATLEDLAQLYAKSGDAEEAERYFQRALAMRERQLGSEHPSLAATLHDFANFYRDQRRYRDAERLYRRALAIREKGLGPEHPSVVPVLDSYVQFLLQTGRPNEAAEVAKRANAVRAKSQSKGS
jgi:tetratricopeptide (TPR) repeat protein